MVFHLEFKKFFSRFRENGLQNIESMINEHIPEIALIWSANVTEAFFQQFCLLVHLSKDFCNNKSLEK